MRSCFGIRGDRVRLPCDEMQITCTTCARIMGTAITGLEDETAGCLSMRSFVAGKGLDRNVLDDRDVHSEAITVESRTSTP